MTQQPDRTEHPAADIELPPALIVNRPVELDVLRRALADVRRMAVDTESNSLYAYRGQVCLIQISTDERDFLLDPLAFKDAASFAFLGDLLADPAVEKVLHAAEYDVMTLRRDFGYEFASFFDTMIAARVLGWEQVGLGNILEERYGVHVNKRHQRANWGHRPLAPAMLHYAQMDTHYLLDLRDHLYQMLAAGDHVEEAQELFDEVCRAEWSGDEFDPEGYWRISGARDLDRRSLAVLRDLFLFREEQAQRRGVPVFKVMSDQALLVLARAKPQSLDEARRLRGVSDLMVKRYGAGILGAVTRGLKAEPPTPPRRNGNPVDEAVMKRYEALHTWRKECAARRGVSSEVIMSKEALWELAGKVPRTPEQLERIRSIGPWRRQTYGSEVLKVLAGLDGASR